MIIMKNNVLDSVGNAYTSSESLKFFSFADFSHALSLLHPNRPENIFGKTYFLQPEFLIFPILVFFSLLNLKKSKYILFFGLLGLIGAFLAKGANEPFESVFVSLFEHIPGFIMFRDPTKFYVLTAIAYSLLIPASLHLISKKIVILKRILSLLFVTFFLFTIRQAFFGQLSGTFAFHAVPGEYSNFAEFIRKQPDFFRVLWVPRQNRFSYASLTHMPSESEPLFQATNSGQLLMALGDNEAQELLRALSIKYVAIQNDSLGELFLSDRKYDELVRQQWVDALDTIPWLTKIQNGKITLYQTPNYYDLFWSESGEKINYVKLRQDRYQLTFIISKPTTIYFSQNFHPGWVMQSGEQKIFSQKTQFDLNSFAVTEKGEYTATVFFSPQQWVDYGVIISIISFVGSLLLYFRANDRKSALRI